jgi:hypothetical protein
MCRILQNPFAIKKAWRPAIRVAASAFAAALLGISAPASGGSVGPDVTVIYLPGVAHYTPALDPIQAYSVGTTSCNIGDEPLNWCDEAGGCGMGTTSADHPVIAQNLYRLKDDRFEQIGMSWLKHGFFSVNSTDSACGPNCIQPPLGGSQLGVGCTDPYGPGLNGSRPLGMRSEVNSSTGVFPFPYTEIPWSQSIDQRIQVARADLDPDLNPGALYWVEGHYIAPDDAQAENGRNNASYREVTVNPTTLDLSPTGPTVRELSAIDAWQAEDPEVEIVDVNLFGSAPLQRFEAAARVTRPGGPLWHYEFAIRNMNSDRSGRGFTVQFPQTTSITNAGFHDVDHHSGEPYLTADWAIDVTPTSITWSTDDFSTDPNANALRFGTMFTFWFDADTPPVRDMDFTLNLFKPGTPPSVPIPFKIGQATIFLDGFESGDTSRWSLTQP